jgi:hypothetical protein
MPDYYNSPQWQNCLRHLGWWRGSFTNVSIEGAIVGDTPTLVTLDGEDDNRKIKQTVQRFPTDGSPPRTLNLEYTTLSRGLIFFDNGAFSLGSMQYAPFTAFGGEFGFIEGDRRLRLVELFDESGQFSSVSLIRERRDGTESADRPPLTIDDLIGTWDGEAVTHHLDYREPTVQTSRLTIARDGNRLRQTLSAGSFQLETSATIAGNTLNFAGQDGAPDRRILLLPDGGSCNIPLSIPRDRPFFLEAGWLISPTLRIRTMRNYDRLGGCTTLTCVTEHKVA